MGEGQRRAQNPARHGVGAVHVAQHLLLGVVEDPALSPAGRSAVGLAGICADRADLLVRDDRAERVAPILQRTEPLVRPK